MSWRFFVFVSTMLAMLVINAALIFGEAIPQLVTAESADRVAEVSLRSIQYQKSQVRANFLQMGLSREHADKASTKAESIWGNQKRSQKLLSLMRTHEEVVAPAVCPSGQRVAQPYAVLQLVVKEDFDVRSVMEVDRITEFKKQSWYDGASVEQVYSVIELSNNRQSDATLMGVSALLLGKEEAALKGDAPWSTGFLGRWGYDRLVSDPKTKRIESMSTDYFALMYALVTLANDERDGICDS